MRLLKLFAALIALCVLPFPARAQFQGFVGLQTVNATVANNVTCTGTPQNFTTAQNIANFKNLGQTSHLATATSNASQFQMEIDGLDNLGNVFRLSDLQLGVPTSAKGGLVVTASGYMTNIQISVTCTALSTFSISYSGSFSPQPPNLAGALLVSVDKLPFQTAAANATTSTTFQTPTGNSAGTIIFQYSATGPAGSTVAAQCLSNSNQNLQLFSFPLGTGSTAQLFTVTPSSCPFVTLTYTSGGASAVTYNMEYVFNAAGTQATLTSQNSGPSSTLPIQVISDSVMQAFDVSPGLVTNPLINTVLLNVNANSGAHSIYFDKLYLSTTANAQFTIIASGTTGTGCSAITIGNMNLSQASAATSTALANQGCTGVPGTQGPGLQVFVAANTTVTIDLRGFIAPAGTTKGLYVFMPAAVTGSVTAWGTWYEK